MTEPPRPRSDSAPPKKTSRLPAHLLTIGQLVVAVGLLYWIFHNPARRDQMWQALSTADWRWMLLATLAAGTCEFFGILRWQLFLRMLQIEVPLREIGRLFFIGAFFNQFLPGTTGGDVMRVLFLMRDHPEYKAEGLLSVAIDRLLAVFVLGIMGLLFAWTRSAWFAQSFAVGNLMKWFTIILFAMTAGLVVSFVLTRRDLILRLPRKMPFHRAILKLSRLWQLCIENRRESLLGAFYTVPMLLAYFAAFGCAAEAFTSKASFWDVASIMPLVTAIASLPLSPNGMGVREVLFGELLSQLCGVPKGTGQLISIAGMAAYLLWGLLGGVFYLERIKRRYPAAG